MSQAAVDVEVRLKMQDGVSAGLKTVTQAAEKTAKATSDAAEKAATATERAAKREADATEQSTSRQRSSHERLSHARTTLGMRSEQAIQREIQQTTAAYNRLMATGKLSFDEQGRAADKMRDKVTQLTNEMGKLTAEQRAQADQAERIERGRGYLRTGAAALAGAGAAAYTLKAPAMAAMSFDERLAAMANTAYAERDVAGRKVGMGQLEAAINRSVGKGGGGTRDQAAEALDMLIASGAVGINEAMAMLPDLMKASAATSTDALQLAQIGVRGMQTFKVAPDQFMNLLNMALAGGQAGGFELSDMAQWLPQQMAAATQSGMSGRAGFAELVALNQAAAITAGNSQQAGNNVLNLLGKINSDQVARSAKDELGLDLGKHLQDYRARGLSGIDAFAALVEKSVAKNTNYQALQGQLAGAGSDGERRVVLESMANIAQGTGIGKIIADREATMALIGMLNNRAYMDDVLAKVRAADVGRGGAVDVNYGVVSDMAGFKLRMAEQQKDAAQKDAMDSLTPAIGRVSELFGDMVAKYPLLSGATMLATGAIAAFATAAGLAAMALNGGKLPGAAGGAIDRVARAAGSPVGRKLGRGAKVGGVAGVGSLLGGVALDAAAGEDSAIARYGNKMLTGAALGATFGSFVPGAGTALGGLVGGLGGLAWEGVNDLLKPSEPVKTESTTTINLGLSPGLVVTGMQTQTSGPGVFNMNTGSQWDGAPR